MASNPNRLELMRRAKLRKVDALRRKISESLRQLVGDLPATRSRPPS